MLGSDSGNTGYTGVPATIVTGYMVLLGLFLVCGSSAPVRIKHEGGAAAWVVGPWQCQMCRDTNYLSCRSYSPNRIFLASGS